MRHRVAGVDREVHDHLLDAAAVGHDAPEVRAEPAFEVDVFADQSLQHPLDVADHLVEVEHLGPHHLVAAEAEQLPRQRRGAFGGLGDLPAPASRAASRPAVCAASARCSSQTTVSRLLKSCAMPPASRPRASSFCD